MHQSDGAGQHAVGSQSMVDSSGRPIDAKLPTITYFICCMARTGSTFLCDLLASTGLAGYPGEYFQGPVDLPTVSLGTAGFGERLRRNLEEGTDPNGVFGTKIVGFQYLEAMVEALRELHRMPEGPASIVLEKAFPNLHYIWLTRRDKLRQAISYRRGRMKGSPDEKIFDPTELERWMLWMARDDARWQQFFDAHGIHPFRATYEELVQKPKETATEVLRFIGISIAHAVTFGPRTVEKEADAMTEEWVERYRALKSHNSSGWTRSLPH